MSSKNTKKTGVSFILEFIWSVIVYSVMFYYLYFGLMGN